MTQSYSNESKYIKQNITLLNTIDPLALLDDLEPLRKIVENARIVAIGESTHHVSEYFLVRHRIARFLIERCGFTHVAMEAPFCEGLIISDWVNGGQGEIEEISKKNLAFWMGESTEMQNFLKWIREYNRTSPSKVHYTGIDPPQTNGSLVPALNAVLDYVSNIEIGTAMLVRPIIEIAKRYEAENLTEVIPAYRALKVSVKQDLTARLSQLLSRFRDLRPVLCIKTDVEKYELILRILESAVCLDHYCREMEAVWSGKAVFNEGSSRDAFMAGSISWIFEHGDKNTKIVLAAHNAHTQRIPWLDDGHYMQGSYLSYMYGPEYISIAVTAGGGTTVSIGLDPETNEAFIEPVSLNEPVEESIEYAIANEHKSRLSFVDLREARGQKLAFNKIRMGEYFIDMYVPDAFDGIIYVPTTAPGNAVSKHLPKRR